MDSKIFATHTSDPFCGIPLSVEHLADDSKQSFAQPSSLASTASSAQSTRSEEQGRTGSVFVSGDVRSRYVTICEIRSGAFGAVRKVKAWGGNKAFAVKSINRHEILAAARHEVHLHLDLNHPNVVKLHAAYDNGEELSLVMEFLEGGDAMDLIERNGKLSEERAATLTQQVLSGLQYLHDRWVMHLDVKPENLVFVGRDRQTLKLVDFGLSRRLGEELIGDVGTSRYMAPEVRSSRIQNFSYDTQADMFSLGVVVHVFLTGMFASEECPWSGLSPLEVLETRHLLSFEAKDFVESLLREGPYLRLNASAAQSHSWLSKAGRAQGWFQCLGQMAETICNL